MTMIARDYARSIITSDTLAGKLVPPPDNLDLVDSEPPLLLTAPGRPASLAIVSSKLARVPPIQGMRDKHQRALAAVCALEDQVEAASDQREGGEHQDGEREGGEAGHALLMPWRAAFTKL